MPAATGTSNGQVQRLVDFKQLTDSFFDIKFTAANVPPFTRVGYGYVFLLDSTTPFQPRLILSAPVYKPGTFLFFNSKFGFTSPRYTLIVSWNVAGLPWTVSYP